MNKQQAIQLIKDTFARPFDRDRFRLFAVNVLNRMDETKSFARNSTYIKDAFKSHVQRFERLGTYTSPDKETVDVLVVHLTGEAKLERARTAIRNFVADHLKERDEKDAALVAFVSPTETQWRLSYIKMEYATVEKESGKIGVEARLTPARRFSYLVGEGESCHTAQTRFLDLLQDTATDPTLAQIEDAFSVEAVTKEFFGKYAALFGDINAALEMMVANDKTIRDEFKDKNVSTVDFAKKLMGQIVFLYFLQKKGWLGVEKGKDWGTGPRDFLRRMADGAYGKYDNFFNDILEPLFYDTLATDRGHDAWCSRFKCRIPFLNGGLFEPLADYDWKKTDILIPNKLFTNDDCVEEGITGTGVLDVFDRYNFTVNEAEPLEKDIAIDPEMLGKVFENLIEENRRKGLGAFYTPREIVHYMCQESLINHLDTAVNCTDKPLVPGRPKQDLLFSGIEPEQLSLKGSVRKEVVPRSDIETFIHLGDQISHYEAVETEYRIKMPKSIEKNAKALDEALETITVCDPAVGSGAFPVGMMTEIVRARAALTPYFNDVAERTPYHFKRHAIQNCLYGVDIDSSAVEIAKLRLWLSLVVDEEDVKQVKPLPNLDYRIVPGNSLIGFPFKSNRLHEIEALKTRFFEETDHKRKAELKGQIDAVLAASLASSKRSLGYEVNFDFEIFFSEVFYAKGGFDVVIANPPYVRHETISDITPVLRQRFTVGASRADLLVFFYEQGVRLLRQGGVLTLITSNKYYRAAYGAKLRPFLKDNLQIKVMIDFGDAPVFEAIAYASILIGTKDKAATEHSIRACTWPADASFDALEQTLVEVGLSMEQSGLKTDGWRIESPAAIGLLDKLRSSGTPLGQYVYNRFYYGIKTGLNEAFVIDRETRDRLIHADRKSAELIKPFLRGRDVKRWVVHHKDLYLIVFPFGFHAELKKYPAILRHLSQFEDALKKRGQCTSSRGRKEGGQHHWLELDNNPKPEYLDAFAVKKIVMPAIERERAFAVDSNKHYSNDKTNICIADDPEALCAILNSSAIWWSLTQIAATKQNGYYEFKPLYIRTLPIPATLPADKARLTKLAERAAKQAEAEDAAGLRATEREIDEIVYRLFDLTPDEIAHIEKSLIHGRAEGSDEKAEENE
ncbi:MAG: Eco57I restriction-modification methylase domain-containing protein [Kiritimatiellae bacterium]|nr:Eco57I restriction-modification methylase domain-containing protein [Kiritimatiellia bacterium]MCO5068360.1 Eco57I restriction-modification methylase domain-containing protein [Kiritimatiellia bacterium]